MSKDNYTINDALNYAETMDKMKRYSELNPGLFAQSMKLFADAEDKDNFRRVVDKYLKLLKNAKYEEDVQKNPLSFLEYVCAGMDHGFSEIGHSLQKLEPGNAQKVLREVYKIGK